MKTKEESLREDLGKRGYILRQNLGRGAFSRVYCVEEQKTGRQAACKVSENTALLRREAGILDRLRHPLFPEVYDIWQEGDRAFLLMELIQGKNLAVWTRQGGRFAVCQTAETGMELAEGLLYLHDRPGPVLFRDVKPENIMLRPDGRVKLLDFGCACVSGEDAGSRAGTPGYAAPEQFEEGVSLTPACDVYGLGRTLQALSAPEGPGRGLNNPTRFKAVPGEAGRQRDRRRLERILEACVEREPSARPADMRVVMAALFPLCAGGHGKKGRGSWGGDFWQSGVICEKNIWKCAGKMT